jgi:hypothetical protein
VGEFLKRSYELLPMSHKTRIMYIENKSDGLVGPARIGRVTFSKSGKSVTDRGTEFGSLKGTGFKANFWNPETGEQYWISGCKKDGLDSLYPNEIEIDEDVREEYWVTIRNRPDLKQKESFKCLGKYSK